MLTFGVPESCPQRMSNELEVFAEGGNYRVTILADGIAHFRVWRRMDVSRAVGAAYAQEMVGVFERLTQEPWTRVRGVVYDLSDASTTWGPITQAAIGQMFSTMEKAGRWLAVVAAPDAIQLMTVSKAVQQHAPRHGRAFGSLSNGKIWAGQRKRLGG